MTIQELPEFAEEADRLLGERSHAELIAFLGLNPEAGVIVQGTGGVRKLRWSISGRGKRGGARVIYYFHSEEVPLLALDIFAKNEQSDLSPAQKKTLKALVKQFVDSFGR